MLAYRRIKLSEEKEKFSDLIYNWSQSREQILNVISVPYNSVSILLKTIFDYLENQKKVLYITNEDESFIEILDYVRKYSNFRDYSYLRNANGKKDSKFIVCNYETALCLRENFDLIIYDDISSFSTYKREEIMELLIQLYAKDCKLICCSIESIFKNKRELLIPVKDNKIPFAEPRIITTRIDINKDIPYVVYEFLNWSVESERKVIIFVPDEEKVKNVYRYLSSFPNISSKELLCFIKNKTDLKTVFNFLKMKKGIIITDGFDQICLDVKGIDVMVYFADHKCFTYKKLIYFCGKVGRGDRSSRGEVIFLASEETDEMESARNIARHFNKEAWETGLLRI